MAGEFLRSHGVDIDAEMHRIQHSTLSTPPIESNPPEDGHIERILNVSLPSTEPNSRWDITLASNEISNISATTSTEKINSAHNSRCINAHGALLAPSLCHPHIHLDKPYLLSHPNYSHLQIERGDFAEAMELTGKAKAHFTHRDLLERGQRLIDESVAAGVTHMRAFVEVDAGVGLKCLEAGVELKRKVEGEGRCIVQLCAFAQLPLFSASNDDPEGKVIRDLMVEAAEREEVDCVGSTPYVETDRGLMERNVEWMAELSARHSLHLDFHLDYNLDPETEPLVWNVVAVLKHSRWAEGTKVECTVVLGHCTRLTLFPDSDWQKLKEEVADLPISFVGLPTSDLFMMGRNSPSHPRATLDIPRLIKEYGLNACIGINNIGNAFTPHGSADPLTLACNGVGTYQSGTKRDAEILYECISTRARAAIGLGRHGGAMDDVGLEVKEGDTALLLFGADEKDGWKTRKSVAEAVYLYDHCQGRRAFLDGKMVAGRESE